MYYAPFDHNTFSLENNARVLFLYILLLITCFVRENTAQLPKVPNRFLHVLCSDSEHNTLHRKGVPCRSTPICGDLKRRSKTRQAENRGGDLVRAKKNGRSPSKPFTPTRRCSSQPQPPVLRHLGSRPLARCFGVKLPEAVSYVSGSDLDLLRSLHGMLCLHLYVPHRHYSSDQK